MITDSILLSQEKKNLVQKEPQNLIWSKIALCDLDSRLISHGIT